MGKANRTKRADQEAKQLAANERKTAQSLAQKKAKRNKFLGIVAGVLAVVLIGSLLVYNRLDSSGTFMRQTEVATTANYAFDQTHASYFFHTAYQNFMSTYGDMATQYFGLDTSLPLKAQSCMMLENGTWFDYFMTSAKSNMTMVLLFMEEAKAMGITLDKEDEDQIDETIKALKETAKLAGVSESYYIHAMYGAGVNKSDLRDMMEATTLYSKAYEQMTGAYSFTQEDYKAYLKDHEQDLKKVDYLVFEMSIADGKVEGEVTAKTLEDYVKRFTAAKNADAFLKVAEDYMRTVKYKNDGSMDDEAYAEELEALRVTGATYTAENEFSEWAFDAKRKANNTYSIAAEDGTTQTVYMLTATAAIDESVTKNVRHILLSSDTYGSVEAAKAKAEELMAQLGSAPTAEAFAALAETESEDSSAAQGGLIENIAKGATVANFDSWIFDSARKAGEIGLVESEYGCHVVYYVGDGLKAWEATAESALWNEKYQADYAALAEKHAITFDQTALYGIDA